MAGLYKLLAYLKISLASLRANKLRSFLSITGVVFGVMAVILIIAVGEGAKAEALLQIERLGTRNVYIKSIALGEDKARDRQATHSPGLSASDLARIQNGCPHIRHIAALTELPVSVIGTFTEMTPQVVSCDPAYFTILSLKTQSGRFFTENDREGHQQVCVIGADVAAGLGAAGVLGGRVRIETQLFKIIGILSPYTFQSSGSSAVSERNYNQMILLPMGAEKWILPDAGQERPGAGGENPDAGFSEVIIAVDATDHVLEAARIIKPIMEKTHGDLADYQIVTPLELLRQSRKTSELFAWLLFGIASLSLLVGGIGIMNIMLATVSERRREIGIRRAVGAKQRHIRMQFLTEAALLTFSGGIIGIFGGFLMVMILKYTAPWPLVITLRAVVLPLAIAILTGVFFGAYPAFQAARMDPIQALRE